MKTSSRNRILASGVMVFALLSTAATAGDVGAWGRTATLLQRGRYENARKLQDCARCTECGIANDRCRRACDRTFAPDIQLPATCRPIEHDGEVCLRAIDAVDCDRFATYVDDVAPSSPSECEFCKVGPELEGPGLGDGGVGSDASASGDASAEAGP